MFISVNGCSLFVQDEGKGVPLVFVHGFPLSSKMWEPQIKNLKKNYRTIAYDCRGHGQSAVGDGITSVEDHVDDLVALLDELKLPKVILVALSMGGYIALRLAARNPDRLMGLILLDTRAEADSNEGKLKRFRALKDIRLNGLAPYAETSILSLFSEETLNKEHPIVDLVFEMIMNSNAHAVMGTLLSLASRYDMTDALAAITVPTLLLVGEYDLITPVSTMEAMAQQIPGAKFCVVPGAGHMSNLENASFVNDCIRLYLDTCLEHSEVHEEVLV